MELEQNEKIYLTREERRAIRTAILVLGWLKDYSHDSNTRIEAKTALEPLRNIARKSEERGGQ